MAPSFPKLLFLAALLPIVAGGQAAPPPPQLSPQSAYDQVVRPLEITRRSVANWSNSETAALALAIKQASEQCAARTPEQFSGDPLIAFARLCSLGQQWPAVGAAATSYIASEGPKPQLAQAYAFQVDAALHTNDPKAILASSLAMLHAVPYDALVDETSGSALHYLQLVFTPDALTLYADREPLILTQISKTMRPAGSIPSENVPSAAPADSAVPIHTLYAGGIAYAALEQFAGDPHAATKIVTDLDAALPSPLQPDDFIPIDQIRRQYALLGTPLPRIPLTLSLYSAQETPRINTNYGSSTVLLLFPDWCAQCVRMAQQILPTLFRVSESGVHLYGLLAQPAPSVPAPPGSSLKPKAAAKAAAEPEAPIQKNAADLLRGTPTLIVPPETLIRFAATDFPLLIATDPKGVIRFIQPASENALNPGDFLDQVTARIARQWPRAAPAQATPPTTSAQP